MYIDMYVQWYQKNSETSQGDWQILIDDEIEREVFSDEDEKSVINWSFWREQIQRSVAKDIIF